MRLLAISRWLLSALLLFLTSASQAQLGTVLDAPGLTWTTSGTGGSAGWGTSTTSHDGVSAAQSGVVTGAGQSSTLQTTVSGPGTLTFWWNSPSIYNSLSFLNGNTTLATTSGDVSWRQQTVYLGAGSQTVKWVYSFVFTGTVPQRAYLDQVSFTPGSVEPSIAIQPVSQSQVKGLNATFRVSAVGTPPLAYQWRYENADIAGATTSTVTITNVGSNDLGNYSVVVTNQAGSILSSNALLALGEATTWGLNDFGQNFVSLEATNLRAISIGAIHGVGLRADGTLFAWGTNSAGQLTIPPDLTNVIAISAGGYHNLALRSDGTVTAWGAIYTGEITNVPPDLTNAVAIAGGLAHSLALRADGTVVGWGSNTSGQTNVPANLTNAVAIAAGASHSLALRTDGTVIGWGDNSQYQTAVPPSLTNVVGIAAGQFHSVALREDGTVVAWTRFNTSGETNVPPGLTNAVAITAGLRHCLALRADGSVVGWGRNVEGQTNTPTALTNVLAIDAGHNFNAALVGAGFPILTASPTNLSLSGGGFSLALPTQSGRVLQLQYKDSLADSQWMSLPLVAGTGEVLALNDPTCTNSSQRFYRVRRW